MKKVLAIILVILAVFSLSACKKKDIIKVKVPEGNGPYEENIDKNDDLEISFSALSYPDGLFSFNKNNYVALKLNTQNKTDKPLKFKIINLTVNEIPMSVSDGQGGLYNAVSPGGYLLCEYSFNNENLKEKDNIIEFVVVAENLKEETIYISKTVQLKIDKFEIKEPITIPFISSNNKEAN